MPGQARCDGQSPANDRDVLFEIRLVHNTIRPSRIHQTFFADYVAAVLGQNQKDFGCFERQMDWLASTQQHFGVGVEAEFAKLIEARALGQIVNLSLSRK